MDSTNFQPDHHHRHRQQHYLHLLQQQQQQQQQPPYPYAAAYSPLLDVDHQHHLGYGVSPPPENRHHNSNLLSTNQGSYSSCVNGEEVPSASSGVTNSDTSTYSYHSLSSNNDDVMASPNFLSNFLGIINQTPNEANQLGNNQWIPPQIRSNNNNNSFSSLLSSSGATNALGQLGLTSSPSSSSLLGLNLQPSDLFNGQNCFNGGGGRQFPSYGDHHHLALTSPGQKIASGGLSWPSRSRALDSTKVSTVLMNNGVAGIKRPAGSNCSDTSSKSQSGVNSNKKTTLKNPCPPFKVRKEKLGDRIAALHQLVSPFGKTDTASVLTEAIGYIQFLQDQIHTLCMPNVKPLRNKPCNRIMQPISSEDHQEEINEEGEQDLKKRGMCLVPLSWTSFITTDQMDPSISSLPAHHYY
ncbi:hypothetical protein V2J09_021808 [Rumex salicifolius]